MERKTIVKELIPKEKLKIDWKKPVRRPVGEALLKNLGVAAALVMCCMALKGGAVPGASGAVDAVLTAATDDSLLDDHLGKLSFVSTLFPEATLVFGESQHSLCLPVSGGAVVHAWSEAEPYMAWRTQGAQVLAAGGGTVAGVYHGENEERLVQVTGEDGISCVYGNLQQASVQMGDRVQAGEPLGTLMEGEDCVLEVRVDGVSVDPAAYLGGAS